MVTPTRAVNTNAATAAFPVGLAAPGPAAPVNDVYLTDESTVVQSLLKLAEHSDRQRELIHATAVELVEAVRKRAAGQGGLDAFLKEYDLSSQEGIMLMCIAEALLRIPDADTADELIADKLSMANWQQHIGTSESLFVNASTWGLMLTGRMLALDEATVRNPGRLLGRLVSRAGEPVVRAAMRSAMRIMGHQFVTGRDIDEALKRSVSKDNRGYRYSFDMLGEAALTRADATRYFDAYRDAIGSIGKTVADGTDVFAAPGISVKLSALHPRYEFARREQVLDELAPMLLSLAQLARDVGIGLTMDAEEADRLEISLEIFDRVYRDPSLAGYEGLGLAVQAYQKRGADVIRWITALSAEVGRRIPVRLVKGAYWDTEVKHAQQLGLPGYPVFTRKVNTDVSYLACARLLLDAGDAVYPQFATHNAHTLSYVLHHAGARRDYEFQRLHGMGEELYESVIDPRRYDKPCRVYAPVGSHEDLLPYLVRRLLENGANTSFVNRIVDEDAPVEDIVADPITEVQGLTSIPHPRIPLPADLFGAQRRNSTGFNLADRTELGRLYYAMEESAHRRYDVRPLIDGKAVAGTTVPSINPARHADVVGTVAFASAEQVVAAIDSAASAWTRWDNMPAADRARILRDVADRYERHGAELMALCVREAGKSLPDAIAELREAVDFLRYYAAECERLFGSRTVLPGPTGERNIYGLRGRGVFVCISPWNFPLAIFTGQVAAALAAGNAALAKPAEQTSIVAARAVELFHEAGVPGEVLHFLPGDGADVGGTAVADPRVCGVAFTGSTETARRINRALADRDGPIATLIAETGGQNAMVVDSSALPEQVVQDAVQSGFNSAGQRCSALRILCLQRDIAPRIIELLKGAMDELIIGDPADLATDVGPVIDDEARGMLEQHVESITASQTLLHRARLPDGLDDGTFFAPALIEIDSIDALKHEVFGPVIHVLRYRGDGLPALMDAINATGFGLTFGVHSRIDGRAARLAAQSAAGNVYINRDMVGAVVGVQPFGGRGLSGTGPKAGGPNYLPRFASEFSVSNNTAAVGGNASLLSLDDRPGD